MSRTKSLSFDKELVAVENLDGNQESEWEEVGAKGNKKKLAKEKAKAEKNLERQRHISEKKKQQEDEEIEPTGTKKVCYC